ncbi:MAG: hypothetical protein JKX85_11845 [Phycisphaeraceae bacterium]|nr:hypothetical protein [Phycisphaeraceae bacterium]
MKIPQPTTNNPLNKDEETGAHRAAMIPMLLGLLVISAFAVYTVWDDVLPRRVRKVTTGQMQMDMNRDMNDSMGGIYEQSYDWTNRMIPDNNVGNFLLIRQGDQVLLSEPANLPAPANGKRVSGFTRTDGHITEQYALWQVTGQTQDQIQRSYADAAISMGFSKLQTRQTTQQSNATSQVYVRSPMLNNANHLTPPAEQVLVIRARPDGDAGVKLLLWYRHPISINRH